MNKNTKNKDEKQFIEVLRANGKIALVENKEQEIPLDATHIELPDGTIERVRFN